RFESEYRVIHPGGEVRWVRALGGVDAASDGSRRIIGVAQDVTERRAFEAQLARSQKMEAINRLAGGIAHDFNNLLMVMMGQVSLAQRRLAQPELVSVALDELNLAIERAASLTQQLLAFARRQATRQEVIDFAAVLRDIESLITRIIGEDVVLELAIPEEPVSVRADRSQLEQVVFNLVVNARDAMPEGGRLSIRLSEERHPDALPGAANALLEVRDAGSGIPAEIRERIFEPFFTTKPPGQGSGLGLSTVYAIVEQANGRIEVESEPGQRGSAFCVRWPLVPAPLESSVSSAQLAAEERVACGEVLLVEDDAQVRGVLSVALRDLGYLVHTAENADVALESLRGPARGIRALVTDVVMPGASGPVLVRRARALLPRLPVVLLSGYAADHVDRELLLDPGVQFLQKPVSMGDLAHTLDLLLRG
ncbi:MAG: response regulator, partial [Polyangiaceae bacterium]|nr:response regulator [Polyangiaceae bacterium]